jgi:hypothetical protein
LGKIGEIEARINDLKEKRKWFLILFLLFVLLPVPIASLALYSVERCQGVTLTLAFSYCFKIITGIDTNATITPKSEVGSVIIMSLGVFKVVFLGLAAGIIVTSVEIMILKRRRPLGPPGEKQ